MRTARPMGISQVLSSTDQRAESETSITTKNHPKRVVSFSNYGLRLDQTRWIVTLSGFMFCLIKARTCFSRLACELSSA